MSSVTSNNVLHTDGQVQAACKLIARHYGGPRGLFAYECFEDINARFFGNGLPWPLIHWAITPHGQCMGFTTRAATPQPVIVLHPSTLKGTEKTNPWGIEPALLGVCFVYDVLLHECIHVKVEYVLGGWREKGETSHNNSLWVGEVNRLVPLLGFASISVGRSLIKRVAMPGQTTPNGKPATRVARIAEGNVPFGAVATFPYGLRKHLGLVAHYQRDELPFKPNTDVAGL
jgi:hypothetical protein